jgi:hypothetical protein
MMGRAKKSPEDFWREYEATTGETIVARSLGQYLSGWQEFPAGSPLWGLIIATSGGFRFHHFPQTSWFSAFARTEEPPKEKTIFIPKESITAAVLHKETKWYKKLFSPSAPFLEVFYRDEGGEAKTLLLQVDFQADGLVEALKGN